MKRYHIYAEGDPHESELIIEEYGLGKWVKYEDLGTIKSRDAKMIKLHSKINQLSFELELAKERISLVHTENERLKKELAQLIDVPFSKCKNCEFVSHVPTGRHCIRGEGDSWCIKQKAGELK